MGPEPDRCRSRSAAQELALPLTTPSVLDGALVGPYGLNPSQTDALGTLLGVRPLGLLQGPPGTGKTKFIAALTHYALAKGLVRNVLLASQSHEAVNNAAEAVLALFRRSEGEPSILRVGAEGVVSDRLLPYHSERVELLYKDRFRAQQRERLQLAGRAIGLPKRLVESYSSRPQCGQCASGLPFHSPARLLEGPLMFDTDTLASISSSLRAGQYNLLLGAGSHWPAGPALAIVLIVLSPTAGRVPRS
jgi:AAA domain